MNYYLRPGDMLEVAGGFGLVTKVGRERIEYWTRNNTDCPGTLFKVYKVTVYDYIDKGKCVVYLGSAKNRRKRKK
jgi:hypothetical protein